MDTITKPSSIFIPNMFPPANSQETSSVKNDASFDMIIIKHENDKNEEVKSFDDMTIVKEEIEDEAELNNSVEVSSKVCLIPLSICCLFW